MLHQYALRLMPSISAISLPMRPHQADACRLTWRGLSERTGDSSDFKLGGDGTLESDR